MLFILFGCWRDARIDAVRGDAPKAPLRGMTHVVSEDVVRRAIKRIEESEVLGWLSLEL